MIRGQFERLKTSSKKRYPFRLAVPSYIYPADWCTNVEMVGPHVDEVELLFLESHADSCYPSAAEIRELSVLAKTYSLSYNIHLPSDISLSDPSGAKRREAVDTLSRVISLTAPLKPSTWTLHLPFDRAEGTPVVVKAWRDRNRDALLKLLRESRIFPRALSIETLFYPFEWIGEIIRALDLSVCLDAGHLMIKGVDLARFYAEYSDIISIMHLHGVRDPSLSERGEYPHAESDSAGSRLIDHVSLDLLSPDRAKEVLTLLGQFSGIVSVEVFSFHSLSASLDWLSNQFQPLRSAGEC
jgi:sugar phosphate isomerase/epimerase